MPAAIMDVKEIAAAIADEGETSAAIGDDVNDLQVAAIDDKAKMSPAIEDDAFEMPAATVNNTAGASNELQENLEVLQADDSDREDDVMKQSEQQAHRSDKLLNVELTATRIAESVLFDEDDVLLDDELSKVSNKRKSPENK